MFRFVFFLFVFFVTACFAKRSNIVLVLTDDQDLVLNSLQAMPQTLKYVANEGVTFINAFANTPICCPSRSSLLTGQFIHNHGVVNNSIEGNCSSSFFREKLEPHSYASVLHDHGYRTFYAGKYLNQYGTKRGGGINHVPVGWDWWYGLKGNSRYYNYTLSINGTGKFFRDVYLTDYIRDTALEFLNQSYVTDRPFLMVLATPAAHAPFTPAARHIGRCSNFTVFKTPAFNYSGNNKHWLLAMPPQALPPNASILDTIYSRRLETLLAVDEMVAALVERLDRIGVLNDTYIIVTSDHGYHIGQFSMPWDKRLPYDTDIRIPLMLRGPNLAPKNITALPVSIVDLAPTIIEMAGEPVPDEMDGKSFLNRITYGSKLEGIKDILIEYVGEGNNGTNDNKCPFHGDNNLAECSSEAWCKCQDSRNNTYSCVRRLSVPVNSLYCIFSTGYVEVYDLNVDRYQLANIYSNIKTSVIKDYVKAIRNLTTCKGKSCV